MKEKFIKSTIILIIGGFITKILGLFIKIIMTRTIGIEGLSLYTLILPTFSLAMTITNLSLPIAISKLISEEKYKNKNIIFSAVPISIIINIIIITLLIIYAPYLSNNLLHDNRTILPIIAITLTLPFISMSSIIRSYFFGKQEMLPHVISNVIEQITRIILILILIPKLVKINITTSICGIILVNIISETISFLVLFFFLPNKLSIKKKDLFPDKKLQKEILKIAIPTTIGRLITSIFYFFEPIILIFFLKQNGYITTFIQTEYGIIEGYVIPLITLPNFFTIAISNSLLPTVSKYYAKNNLYAIKKKLKQAITISLVIGLSVVFTLRLFPNFFLNLIYNTSLGKNYLLFMLPFFTLYYIQPTLSSILQAINKTKEVIFHELIGILLKTLTIIFLSYLKIGIYNLIIGIIINITTTTLLHYFCIKKVFNYSSSIKDKAKVINTNPGNIKSPNE